MLWARVLSAELDDDQRDHAHYHDRGAVPHLQAGAVRHPAEELHRARPPLPEGVRLSDAGEYTVSLLPLVSDESGGEK